MVQTSHNKVEDYLPRPQKWLSLKVRYKGWGTAHFSNPKGTLEGKTTVSFDETGGAEIELKAERLTIEGSEPVEISSKNFRDFIANGDGAANWYPVPTRNPCEQITVSTPEGTYTANKIAYYLAPFGSTINIRPNSSEFRATQPKNLEKYFVIPLLNFIPEQNSFLGYGFLHHPLRMYVFPEISDDLSENEKIWLQRIFLSKKYLPFKFKDGKDAFIEPLPDFAKRKEKLLKCKASSLATAVLVGEVSSILDFDQLLAFDKSEVPNILLSLLSLATGTIVGTPWIEIRDLDGSLIQRIHGGLAQSSFKAGLGAIPSTITNEYLSIKKLLEQAQTSKVFTELYIPAVISQIVFSGYFEQDGNIEDRMSFVFRGLEKLCDMRKEEIGPRKLEDDITTPEIASKVREIITSALNGLEEIKEELGGKDSQKQNVGDIGGQIKNLLTPELGFGKLILDVLKHNSLDDYKVIELYYKNHPYGHNKKWVHVVTAARNDIFHRVWFKWKTELPHREEFGAILWHLRDIQIRLILLALKYDGHYQPYLRPVGGMPSKPLDWVKSTTEASDLGYERAK